MKTVSYVYAVICLTVVMSLSACLKTRAQLKEDAADAPEGGSSPIPAQVKDVMPQGQYVIDEIKSEITRLTGRIDDLERSKQQQAGAGVEAQSTKDDLKKIEGRITELELAQAAMIEEIKKMRASAPVADPVDLFEKAMEHFQAKDFDAAIESFSQYLKSPKGKKLEEALFYRGEAYSHLKQFKKAIIDFSKFPEKFHKSKKLPAALYKIGLAFEALGMKDDARGFYQELVDKFPNSSEAKKARNKLK